MAEFRMPSLGADMDAGTLVEWLVAEGDTVHRGDPIAVVDTEKSAIEVETFDDGVVESLLVAPGTRVAVGTPMARLAGPVTAPAPVSAPEAAPEVKAPEVKAPEVKPPLRHHAAELGVDLAEVTGTGPGGRITREDVDRAAGAPRRVTVHRPPPPEPTPNGTGRPRVSPYARRLAEELGVDLGRLAAAAPGRSIRAEDVIAARERTTEQQAVPPTVASTEARVVEVTRPTPTEPSAQDRSPATGTGTGRATIAALMSRAKREIPHYYVATTSDLHALTDWLRRTNRDRPVAERVVPAAAVLKATALAARQHPQLNGFWTEDGFTPADAVHLGVAVHVRGGALVAPAIHDTADLSLTELMAALRDLVRRARAGRLRRGEMADPTLTVTDLGDQGVEEVIGVIHPPQVALLGVGRVVERPWAVDGMLAVRPTVRLTLSGDHRATDGATGARFLTTIDELLQHPEEL